MPTYKARFEIDLQVDAKDVFEAKKIAQERFKDYVKKMDTPEVSKLELTKR